MGEAAGLPLPLCSRDYDHIQLAGGWRGMVRWDAMAEPLGETARTWLETLANDSRKLPGHTSLKYSASVQVIRTDGPAALRADGLSRLVVCKHAKASGRFGASRAKKNFERGLRLMRAGICTATPLALLERERESWLVTQYLHDLVDLDQLALSVLPKLGSRGSHDVKSRVTDCVVRLFSCLVQDGLHHRDLKASNILISGIENTGSECHAVVLDLDGLRTWTLHRRRAERSRLTRLAASLLQYRSITRTDYARFLRDYLHATGNGVGDWRAWFREIAAAASSYNRRAQGRKGGKLDGYAG